MKYLATFDTITTETYKCIYLKNGSKLIVKKLRSKVETDMCCLLDSECAESGSLSQGCSGSKKNNAKEDLAILEW